MTSDLNPSPAPSSALLTSAVDDALSHLGNPNELLVLANDPQRHTDTPSVLRILTQRIDPLRIKILVATGSHTFACPHTAKFQQDTTIGLPFGEFAWHDAKSPDMLNVGRTTCCGRENPQVPDSLVGPGCGLDSWQCHPWLLSGLPILAIGSVEPHYFAGYTGAHKTCTLGCAGYSDIERNHAHALSGSCRPCQLTGNPVFEGVLNMLRPLQSRQRLAVINVVQAGRAILGAAGGDPIDSLNKLEPLARHTFVRTIDRPADALIADVVGPLGVSFYQADKGIKNNEWAVQNGGVLILQALCPSGIGQDAFMDILRQANSYDQAVALVKRRGYRLGDHKAVRLRYLTDTACRGVRVFIVSPGISAEDAALLGFTKAESIDHALALSGLSPSRANILHVHDAGNNITAPSTPADI